MRNVSDTGGVLFRQACPERVRKMSVCFTAIGCTIALKKRNRMWGLIHRGVTGMQSEKKTTIYLLLLGSGRGYGCLEICIRGEEGEGKGGWGLRNTASAAGG